MTNDNGSLVKQKPLVRRWLDRVFPPAPDFYVMLDQQCDLAVEAMRALTAYMSDGDPAQAMQVRELEHRGDDLKHRNMDQLNRAFATPMDREDIFRAIISVDDIMGYAKTTVREMEILQVDADQTMRQISELLREGVECLQRGYALLSTHPLGAEQDAQRAHKTEREIEKIYRQSVAELFAEKEIIKIVEQGGIDAIVAALTHVVRMLRRRELYRHLSNAGDKVEIAAEILHDIIVKLV